MGCIYIYNPKGTNIANKTQAENAVKNNTHIWGTSVEAILAQETIQKKIIEQVPQKLLFFYSGSSKDVIKDTLKAIVTKANSHTSSSTGMTSLIEAEFPGPTSSGSTSAPMATFKKNFYTKYGTLIHNCIASKNSTSDHSISADMGSFDDNILALFTFLKLLKEDYETQFPGVPWSDGPLSFDKDSLTEDDLKQSFEKLYKDLGLEHFTVGDNLFFEVPVTFEYKGKTYKGVIDCIKINHDGTIEIIDFKSTLKLSVSSISENTKIKYLLQLELYKALLSQNGIDPDKIKTFIKPITAKGTDYSVMTGSYLDNINSGKYNKLYDIYRKARKVIDKYFPNLNSVVTPTEYQERQVKIKKGYQSLFSAPFLNRENPEAYREYLIKNHIGKSKKYKISDSDITDAEFVFLELENDNIIIRKDKGETVLVIMPFEDFINKELEAARQSRSMDFNNIKQAFLKKDVDGLTMLLGRDNTLRGERIEHLEKYLSADWEMVTVGGVTTTGESVITSIPIADENFILLFRNIHTGDIDVISLVPNTSLDYTYTLDTTDGKLLRKLLANVLDSKTLARFQQSDLPSSIASINLLKAVAMYSAIQDLLPSNAKLGQVMCLSMHTGDAKTISDPNILVDLLKIIATAKNLKMVPVSDDLNIFILDAHKIKVMDAFTSYIAELNTFLYEAEDIPDTIKSKYRDLINDDSNTYTLHERIERLKECQKALRSDYSKEFDKDRTRARHSTNKIQQFDDVLSKVIYSLQGGINLEGLAQMSTTGLDFNNSIRLAHLLFKYNTANVTAEGVSLVGLFQGIDTASPYSNPSEAVRQLSHWHAYSVTLIQKEIDALVDGQNRAFATWMESLKKTSYYKITGTGREVFLERLIQRDSSGEFNRNFRFKNPFNDDASLTDADKEYLKYCIWDILRVRKYIGNKENILNDEKVKKLNWTELSKNEEYVKAFKDLIESRPETLNIPLRKASDKLILGKCFSTVMTGKFAESKTYFKDLMGKWGSIVDDRGLTSELEQDKKEKMQRLLAYNMYNESEADREKRLENKDIELFECNINFLVIDHAYNYVTCQVNQQVLDNTDRMLAVIALIERQTGKDLSKHRDALMKRTVISMYNTNNIDDDYKDMASSVGILRKALNMSAIAFRPALLAKEIIVGRLKNIMSVSFDYLKNEGITLKHLLEAEKIVFSEGMFQEKFNKFRPSVSIAHREKVELINHLYRIANRDANVMSLKASSSKSDLFGIDTDFAYYTNTRPDWYNRLSLMVAKMIADGSWEAHEMIDGKLVYNIKKDKRYSVYFANKDNPPKKGDSNYQIYKEQEARYVWALNEFQKEGVKNMDGTYLKMGDPLPAGYTDKEVISMKEVIGLLYGYFNHEEKSNFQSETFAALMMSFKTFWNAEWRYYFGLPNYNTSRGNVEPRKDLEGNIVYVQTDEVTGIKFDTTEESYVNSKGETVENAIDMQWTGYPTEGIAISFTKCLADIFTEEGRLYLKDHPERYNNAIIFLFRMLWAGFIAALIAWLVSDSDDNEPNIALVKSLGILEKSAKDLNMFTSLDPSDIPLVGVDNLKKLATGAFNSITDADGYNPSDFFLNIAAVNDFLPE